MKPTLEEITKVIESNAKLSFYKKLSNKLRALSRNEISLPDYQKEVIDKIRVMEKNVDELNQSHAAEVIFEGNPPMKPLSELANSEEDCEKVFEFFMGEKFLRSWKNQSGVNISGYGTNLWLNDDGSYSYFGDPVKKPTMFEFVDFLRNIGYQPVNKP